MIPLFYDKKEEKAELVPAGRHFYTNLTDNTLKLITS